MEKSRLIRKFDRQAQVYEKGRNKNVLGKWRHKLLQEARGEVLELAVGAGANFSYYPSDVDVFAVDFSQGMLAKAKEAAKQSSVSVTFKEADIEALDFPADSFDTVVSTLSFCGYKQPVRMLNKINHWCKPTGRVLLMEHGESYHPGLSIVQKAVDPLAHQVVGCHMQRDILGLVKASDLRLERAENHWHGIFHLVWAKPQT